MSYDARAGTGLPGGERATAHRPQWTVLGLLTVVAMVDQATKWWAWREIPGAHINFGGDPLVGSAVGGWYADPVTGGLLDLVSTGVLTVAVLALLRRTYPAVIQVSATLAVAGWGSNLLDRLGLHYVTAPDSIRGAVDFIHVGGYYVNVADLVIVGSTLVLLSVLGFRGATALLTHARAGTSTRLGTPVRVVATSGVAALILAVALGVANYGGVTGPGMGV